MTQECVPGTPPGPPAAAAAAPATLPVLVVPSTVVPAATDALARLINDLDDVRRELNPTGVTQSNPWLRMVEGLLEHLPAIHQALISSMLKDAEAIAAQ
jgi:hypothetical protein